MGGTERRAFVLMPFDEGFRNIYDKLIAPPLEDAGYHVTRADSEIDQQNVLKDVIRGIANADLVIADLTSRNPNVLYELGLSHALGRNTVLLAQSMDEVPFDLRSYRVVRYSTGFDEVEGLTRQLEEIGRKHADGSVEFGSPITDFLPDDGNPEGAERNAGSESASVLDTEPPKKGFLDVFVDFNEFGGDIKGHLDKVGESTQKIGERFEASTEEVESLQRAGGPTVVLRAHKIASEMGDALDNYAQELTDEAPHVDAAVQLIIDGGMAYTSWLSSQGEIDLQSARENREELADLGAVTKEGLESLTEFRQTLVELGPISADMARGTTRAITSLDGIAGSLDQVQAFTEKAVGLLDERLESGGDDD